MGGGDYGWRDAWEDIHAGGSQRWKVTDPSKHEIALDHIRRYLPSETESASQYHVLCPLSGDDPMAKLFWDQGYRVTAIDIVPLALERMRRQFPEGTSWAQREIQIPGVREPVVVWEHESKRMKQYLCDAVHTSIPELRGSVDVVYDKDSFGALPIELRRPYCQRMKEYTKHENGTTSILYLEVKLHDDHHDDGSVRTNGPPYSLHVEEIVSTSAYGGAGGFVHVEDLGVVYPFEGRPNMEQTGHVLRRAASDGST